MQWQSRVRQTFKRKEIEMALLEFSTHQQQQQQQKKIEGKDQDRKSKRAKPKNDHDGNASEDGVSDDENEDV